MLVYKEKRHPLQGQVDHYRRRPRKVILRAESRTRTGDLLITNELLYQLSYFGVSLTMQKYNKLLILQNFWYYPGFRNAYE